MTSWVYVLAVATLATIGFATGSTPAILAAAVLALPSSLVAVPVFYVAYGLLALVPGANPSSSSGTGFCTPGGECEVSTTGDLAGWFVIATDAFGIIALTAAAVTNVVLLRLLLAARRTASASRAG